MGIRCLQGMLAIETFLDNDSQPKLVLTQEAIKQLNQQISKELLAILPQLNDSSYAIVGGLYQSSELLQPGFPIHTQLRQYANAALKGENNRRNQLVIGANEQGNLPAGLVLDTNAQVSPLLLLPFVIVTEHAKTKEIFEQQLMHKGMGSIELLQQVQNTIGTKVRHINFMTILDLAAMMHNHLQMAGFESLWQLLEQAMFSQNPKTKVTTPQFNEFYLSKKIIFTPFFSLVFWGTKGPGKTLADKQEKYLHYIQVQRQYIATLREHGLDVRQFVPTPQTWMPDTEHICFATLEQSRLAGDYYHEIIKPIDPNKNINVDKHTHQHLGVLFFQVTDENEGLEFYYPVTSDGIHKIEEVLKSVTPHPIPSKRTF
ncbi:hypothetical protein MNBD_GAMMA01-495 [hydrothermal vent metagenome]|uniref:Uncharacterized protein n=1 Tax=hydrothermal vent metagenome TaxID=652676 RepID=A0A3B0VUE7_9ZZZZ